MIEYVIVFIRFKLYGWLYSSICRRMWYYIKAINITQYYAVNVHIIQDHVEVFSVI